MSGRLRALMGAYYRRWALWSEGSVNRRILAAVLTVGAGALAVSLATVVKDLVVAYRFGTGDAVDAYLIAWLLPSSVMTIIGGSFSAALIPGYVAVREREGAAAAQRLFAGVMTWSIALLLVLAGVMAALAAPTVSFLGSSFNPDKLLLARTLYLALLLVVVLNGLASIWAAVLNAGEHFALAALSPGVVPLGAMLGVVLFGSRLGIVALAAGTLAGSVIQCGILAWVLHRRRALPWPAWTRPTPEIRSVIGQYLPMATAALLMSSTNLVDQSMAARLAPGSVAALSYANKVIFLVVGLGAVALSNAVLPHFSQLVARGQWAALRHTLRTYVRLISYATVPLALVIGLGSPLIVRLVFQRGAFTAQDTELVARVQALLALQIPFFLVGILFVRLLSSLQRNGIILVGTGISVVLNVAGNYLLMRRMGVAGIALSTSIVYVVSCLFLGLGLRAALRRRAAAAPAVIAAAPIGADPSPGERNRPHEAGAAG